MFYMIMFFYVVRRSGKVRSVGLPRILQYGMGSVVWERGRGGKEGGKEKGSDGWVEVECWGTMGGGGMMK